MSPPAISFDLSALDCDILAPNPRGHASGALNIQFTEILANQVNKLAIICCDIRDNGSVRHSIKYSLFQWVNHIQISCDITITGGGTGA